jgi:phage tail sheath protein FI
VVLVDPPFNSSPWNGVSDVTASAITGVAGRSENAALFFPRIKFGNSLRQNRPEPFAPCGAVAGVIARTDASRGVWKSAAGIDATLNGALGLQVALSDPENGAINPLGVNCLRNFANTGPVVWGSRTLKGADSLASEWKYLAVRRTALFLEESLYRATQWVVFEPNDEPLWSQIRLNVGAFLQNLFRQGAFQGKSPREAYFVKCDRETTTQAEIDLGIVNIVVGFAPLKPAEFVVIKIQQIAGDIST